MSHENFLVLDPEKFNLHAKEVGTSGITVTSTSPYDIPEALHTYKNDKDGTLVIEVKYMGPEEPLDTVDIEQGIQVKTGRNSKRLYEFVLRSAPSIVTIASVRKALAVLLRMNAYPRKDNYRLLADVVSMQQKDIEDILAFTNVNTRK
jgi:hypothetical protein